jgi:hypothetical protein
VSLAGAAADFRAAVDAAPSVDAATFARRTRNAIAQLVLAAAAPSAGPRTGPVEGVWGNRELPPAARRALRAHVGDDLARELVALYDGGEGWTSRAIDVLEPLHSLARR